MFVGELIFEDYQKQVSNRSRSHDFVMQFKRCPLNTGLKNVQLHKIEATLSN